MRDGWVRTEALAGVLLTAVAAAWFWAHPMALVIGVTPQPQLVPWWYQAAAFPPFGALLARAVRDAEARRETALLLGLCAALAAVRLLRWIPLSGHGLFLAAALVFTAPPHGLRSRFTFTTAAVGLAVTAAAKWSWGDLRFFVASALVGGLVGAWGLRRLRARRAVAPVS